jgi:hypothetical protein
LRKKHLARTSTIICEMQERNKLFDTEIFDHMTELMVMNAGIIAVLIGLLLPAVQKAR